MPQSNPPYIPRFGAGAPAGVAPNGTAYYDTANGFQGYIYEGGAWHSVAAGGYVPAFGAGAPSGAAATGAIYYDTSNAFQSYIGHSGVWNEVVSGGGGGGGSAGYQHTFASGGAYQIPNDASSLLAQGPNGINITIQMPAVPGDGQQVVLYLDGSSSTFFTAFTPAGTETLDNFPADISGAYANRLLVWNTALTTWTCLPN